MHRLLRNIHRRLKGRFLVPKKVFSRIHRDNRWGSAESVSGPGSTILDTKEVRDVLPQLLKHLETRILLDAPCGDFNWLSQVDLPVEKYIGIDIVEALVDEVRAKHANSKREFQCVDLISDSMPKADTVLCRDCFVHLSFSDILGAVDNIKRSGARWLIVTQHMNLTDNTDIVTGDWRPVNLMKPPFSWPVPDFNNEEVSLSEPEENELGKSLATWSLSRV